MYDVSFVQGLKSLEGLVQDVGTYTLGDVSLALFNNWCKTSTIHELKKDPKALSVIKGIKASDYIIVVITHFHYTKLISDDLSFLFIFGLNKLQSILLAVIFALDQEDSSETTIPDFLHDFIILRGILL